MARDDDRPSNSTMAFDGYVVRADGYGSLRKGQPPIKQRPPPPAPMMSKPAKSEGTKKPPSGRK
jgi:hypothetical protein